MRLARYQVDRLTVDCPSSEDSSSAMNRPSPPSKIGRYTVLDLLGVGGMGVVCTAYDPKLDRKVALKLLRKKADRGPNSTGQARLVREAQAMAKLTHPNIVTVHDVDKVDGQIYMAMEYVDGYSLDRWMVKAQRSWREVVEVFIQAGRGLAAAHAAGITHRDFKPANVLIGKDARVLVVDFGLAKSRDLEERSPEISGSFECSELPRELLDRSDRSLPADIFTTTHDSKLTQAGRTVGTPAYMAPEQFLGLPVGHQADQFSFGVALFEALYSYLPFPDEDRDELITRVTEGRVADLPKDTPVPGWVHRVVLRMLERNPDDRFANMDAVLVALLADPAKRRRRSLLVAGGGVLVALGGYGIVQGLASADDMCTGATARAQEIWNDARRAEVDAAFESTNLPYAPDARRRVDHEFDRRASAWVDHYVEVCQATNVRREQSARLMDVRMACLERRRGEMRALVDVFVSPDEDVVREAVSAVQRLEDSARCLTELEDVGEVAIDDPKLLEQVEEIDQLLAQAKAKESSGKPEIAVEFAASAYRSANMLGHRSTLARAASMHALLQADLTGDYDLVRHKLVEAIALAADTMQPALEVAAWAKLIVVEGAKRGRPEAALALRIPAELALRQIDDQIMEATLEGAVGKVLHASDDHEAALQAQLRALEKYRSAYNGEQSDIASALLNVGAEYAKLGRAEDAKRYLKEAESVLVTIHGQLHPSIASVRINIGSMLAMEEAYAEAHEEYKRAADVCQASLPAGHPTALRAILGLAQTERHLDPKRSEQRFEEVLAMVRAQKEPDQRVVISSHNSLGRLRREQAKALELEGDRRAAEQKRAKAALNFQAALEAQQSQKQEARSTDQIAQVNLSYCGLEIDQGHNTAALDLCRSAWEIQLKTGNVGELGIRSIEVLTGLYIALRRTDDAIRTLREGVSASTLAQSVPLRIRLADLLWKSRTHRDEAHTLIDTAYRGLAGDPTQQPEVERLDQWLQNHR